MKTSLLKYVVLALSLTSLEMVNASADVHETPVQVAEKFYSAFSTLDYKTMGSLYQNSQEPLFVDPVFGSLNSKETQAMWAMLSLSSLEYSKKTGAPPLQVTYKIVDVQGDTVRVNWVARYVFSETNRLVTNYIRTKMVIQNGKIVSHQDRFNLCQWTKMAFGAPKSLICLAPSIIRKSVRKKLVNFMERMPQ